MNDTTLAAVVQNVKSIIKQAGGSLRTLSLFVWNSGCLSFESGEEALLLAEILDACVEHCYHRMQRIHVRLPRKQVITPTDAILRKSKTHEVAASFNRLKEGVGQKCWGI